MSDLDKDQFARTRMVIGNSGLEKLKNAHVAVFGVGGVGGFAVEALARAGIGTLEITDNDTISVTNINRQIIALHSSVGKYKCDVFKERIHDINPDCRVITHKCFYLDDSSSEFDFSRFTYVVDAVDTVTAKILIIENSIKANVMAISAMGAGNKLNPADFMITDIYKTENDPLARVMRHELRKRGIKALKVVYSNEKPIINDDIKMKEDQAAQGLRMPGSISFVPACAGLLIASEVVKDILK
jgi:tRNA threonylcarbamoyladenosine dehydratase